MKFRKAVSLFAAATMSLSCLTGLTTTASAASDYAKAMTYSIDFTSAYSASSVPAAGSTATLVDSKGNAGLTVNLLGGTWKYSGGIAPSQNTDRPSVSNGLYSSGCALRFTPETDGKVIVDYKLDNNKKLVVEDTTNSNGSYFAISNSTGSNMDTTAADYAVTVTANTTYTVYVTGTGNQYYGMYFEPVSETDPTATPEVTEAPSGDVDPVILKYNSSQINGGNPCGNSSTLLFTSGADTDIASFFADSKDATKLDGTLVSGYKNYISGTASNGTHPYITADLAAGTYTIYFLGYNHGNEVNATIASTNETVYDRSKGVQFAYKQESPEYILKLYTLTFTLDKAVNGETITFNTSDQWLPDLYAVVLTNQKSAGEDSKVEVEGAYSASWTFRKDKGCPSLVLQNSPDYDYTVNDADGNKKTLVCNTSTNGGKLNNGGWDDWTQCNDGTTFTVPAYNGMKLTWDCYNNSTATVKVNGENYLGEYVYTGDGNTLTFSTYGFGYLRTISVSPATMYTVSGTITGVEAGTLEGANVIFTAASGQIHKVAIGADNTISATLPAGAYSVSLESADYVAVTGTVSVMSGSLGEIEVVKAAAQTVSGTIVNAPENATLTFTAKNKSENTKTLNITSATDSYTLELMPDTYTVSSSTETLSPLSLKSFAVTNVAATKNLYFPEEIAVASSFNVTVGSNGEYKSVSDALAGIAKLGTPTADNRATITLAAGETFREQVVVNVPYVTITSDASNPAKITWYYGIGNTYYSMDSNGWYNKDRAMTKPEKIMTNPSNWGTTIQLNKDGVRLENLYIENSFNQYYTDEEFADGVQPNGVDGCGQMDRTQLRAAGTAADSTKATERACALYFRTKNTEVYNCTVISSQDTIGTGGSAYFNGCTLVGNTDYICGGGAIVFDDCDLLFGGYSDTNKGGALTAANGDDEYIFRNCTIGNYQNSSNTRKHGTHSFGRDWGGVNAHVFFLNCTVNKGVSIEKWANMGGAVKDGKADLHVFDLKNPSAYTTYGTTDKYNVTECTFAKAKAMYEGAFECLGFTPAKITNAKTTSESLEGVADTNDYVYGVVTTITAGEEATISGIKWIIKDADNETYELSTKSEVGSGYMTDKGSLPIITGGGSAQTVMLFHAEQGTYDVASIAE